MSDDRYFALETRLSYEFNKELLDYFDIQRYRFNSLVRKIFMIINRLGRDLTRKEFNALRKSLMTSENLAQQHIAGIISEAQTLYKLHIANLKYQISQKKIRIHSLISKKNKVIESVNKLKKKIAKNKLSYDDLPYYRRLKYKIFRLSNKINRHKVKLNKMTNNYNKKYCNICFGSKKLYRRQYTGYYKSHEDWLKAIRDHRNRNVYFMNSFSINNLEKVNNNLYFDLRIRNYTPNSRRGKHSLKFVEGKVSISTNTNTNSSRKFLINGLVNVLTNVTKSPITTRLIYRSNKYYFQLAYKVSQPHVDTTSFYGTIGLDFNNGFISLAETDKHGNLVDSKDIILHNHGEGAKAKLELSNVLSSIVESAKYQGKDIVIEDLDFCKTKAAASDNKSYNTMISLLDYSRYKSLISTKCYRLGVYLKLINPRNTSKVGKLLYNDRMKLTTHRSAAFVIARIGQGYDDRLKVIL